MNVITIQKITNIFAEDNTLISTETSESYVITPDAGKILKNVKTGESISTKICIGNKLRLKNYIEVEDLNAL
jgi:hypothetical protein